MPTFTRRRFVPTILAASGASVGARAPAASAAPAPRRGASGPVIDCHAHLHHHSDPDWKEKVGQLIARLGPDRVVFSTGMPFNAPDPALVKLEVLDATEAVKEQIRGKTAARLFALP